MQQSTVHHKDNSMNREGFTNNAKDFPALKIKIILGYGSDKFGNRVCTCILLSDALVDDHDYMTEQFLFTHRRFQLGGATRCVLLLLFIPQFKKIRYKKTFCFNTHGECLIFIGNLNLNTLSILVFSNVDSLNKIKA